MKYTRSYKVEYNKKELTIFKLIVKQSTENQGYYTHISNYPYDTKDGMKVKTLHITVWHDSTCEESYINIVKKRFEEEGYHIQENSKENKSIPGIPHFHAIKVLSYDHK